MDRNTLFGFIDAADKKLAETYKVYDNEKLAYMRFAKLVEETGELSAEVLKHFGRQHESKLADIVKDDLENELADVIITTLLLAKCLDVDPDRCLERKIEKIKKKLDL